MRVQKKVCCFLVMLAVSFCFVTPSQLHAEGEIGQWINHLDFLPGDSNVSTGYNNVIVRGGGLEITAAEAGRNFVQQGLQVPPGYLVNGVRVCYAQTGRSHIDQVALIQLQDPPTSIAALLNDETTFDNSDPGPVCVNSALPAEPIDPALGALSLRVGVNFANDTDSIVILGVGLLTIPDPNSAVSQLEYDVEQLNKDLDRVIGVLREHNADLEALDQELTRLTNAVLKHTHVYRTGKGVGHNNVEATSSTLTFAPETPAPKPAQTKKQTSAQNKKKKK